MNKQALNILEIMHEKFALAYDIDIRKAIEICGDYLEIIRQSDNTINIYPTEFIAWAIEKNYQLPDEIKTLLPTETKSNNEKTLRPNQIAKIKSQAIAKTLWDQNPDFTIQEIVDHKAIQEFGDGKSYPGKNTVTVVVKQVVTSPFKIVMHY